MKNLYNIIYKNIKGYINNKLGDTLNSKTKQKVDFKVQTLTNLLMSEILNYDPTGEVTNGKQLEVENKNITILWDKTEKENFLSKIAKLISKFFAKNEKIYLTIGENTSKNIIKIDITNPDSFLKFKKQFIEKALPKIYEISDGQSPMNFYNKLSLEEKIKLDTALFEIYQQLKE